MPLPLMKAAVIAKGAKTAGVARGATGVTKGISGLKNKLRPSLMDFLSNEAKDKIERDGQQNRSKSFIRAYVEGYLEGIRQKNDGQIPYDKEKLKRAIIRDFKQDNNVDNRSTYSRYLATTVSSAVNESSSENIGPESLKRNIKTSAEMINPIPAMKGIGSSASSIGKRMLRASGLASKLNLKDAMLKQAFIMGKKRGITSISQARLKQEITKTTHQGIRLGSSI